MLILEPVQPGHGGNPAGRGHPLWPAQENLSRHPQAPQRPGYCTHPLHAGLSHFMVIAPLVIYDNF